MTGAHDDELDLAPIEVMNALTPSGFPQHRLRLRVGAVVILLRNLDVQAGLANGIRLRVQDISPNILRCEILTGERAGTTVFVPRIVMEAKGRGVPVAFNRLQFPVRIGYAVTINRAQGQTYARVGILLPKPVFSHGQLYVSLSRVATFDHVSVYIERPTRRQGRQPANSRQTINVLNRAVLRQAVDLPVMPIIDNASIPDFAAVPQQQPRVATAEFEMDLDLFDDDMLDVIEQQEQAADQGNSILSTTL